MSNTPKKSPNKRLQVDRYTLDCQSLQRSLKRVRLSSSPGELRLQRDLRHLVVSCHWSALSETVWQSPCRTLFLEQPASDPLRLLLKVACYKVWIQIPRMYPHRPPLISRITNSPLSIVIAESPEQQQSICTNNTSNTAVYTEWSPVQRLSHVLNFIVDCLTNQKSIQDIGCSTQEADKATEKKLPTLLFVEEHKMEDADYHLTSSSDDLTFAPNRFDVGYERPPPMDLS